MPLTLDERAALAKEDKQELERLMREYRPFILGCVYNRGFGERDEQISVALAAFYEAVRSYSKNRGSFLTYAGKVIQSRLIDERRRAMRHSARTVAVDDMGELLDARFASMQQSIVDHRETCRLEIEAFVSELAMWGVTLDEVADSAPRHVLTKGICRQALQALLADCGMETRLRESRKLPVRMLAAKLDVNAKILERHRRYLVAAWLIRRGEYEVLKEYVPCGGAEDAE